MQARVAEHLQPPQAVDAPALRVRALLADCEQRKILTPKAVVGYFPCAADGESLRVYDARDPAALLRQLSRVPVLARELGQEMDKDARGRGVGGDLAVPRA